MTSLAPAAGPSSAPFQNIYYQRKVATERPCYICRRPTTTVLATLKTEDFLYTCDGHLSDPGFASPIAPPPTPSGPSEDEIKKVISDYHVKEAKKKDSADKDKKEDKEREKEKEKDKEEGGRKASPPLSIPGIPPAGSPGPAAGHKKYALHRQIFDMRRAEIKRKEQGVKAREVGRGLPQVPRGAF